MVDNGRPIEYRNTLARRRLAAGFRTVKELADKVGRHPSRLSRWECTGELIPIRPALRLKDALGITLDELYEPAGDGRGAD